jgi:hypothetical protein
MLEVVVEQIAARERTEELFAQRPCGAIGGYAIYIGIVEVLAHRPRDFEFRQLSRHARALRNLPAWGARPRRRSPSGHVLVEGLAKPMKSREFVANGCSRECQCRDSRRGGPDVRCALRANTSGVDPGSDGIPVPGLRSAQGCRMAALIHDVACVPTGVPRQMRSPIIPPK